MLLGTATVHAQAKKKPVTRKPATASKAYPARPAGFVKIKDGLEGKTIVRGKGTVTPKIGDRVEINIKQRIGDSLLMSSAVTGKPVTFEMQESLLKGDLMEGIATMKTGDSTIFRIPLDTILNRSNEKAAAAGRPAQTRPEWAKKDAYLIWEVKLLNITDKAVVDAEKAKQQEEFRKMQAEEAARAKAQAATDDSLIQQYLKTKGITNAKKTASGLYYVVTKEGTGDFAKAGQKVTVNYTGRNIKEEVFDSNVDSAFHHVQPFQFNLGSRSVIAGWDEGVALMNKGMKATFFIPSGMAYGPRARAEKIPANAILIFDIELLDFQ